MDSKSLSLLIRQIKGLANQGYLTSPYPSEPDIRLNDLLTLYRNVEQNEREEIRTACSGQDFPDILLTFGERMATQALREGKPKHIADGLLAQSIESAQIDSRENAMVLSLLYDAAGHIGFNPQAMFDQATAYGNSKMAELLKSFSRNPRSIESMGYERVDTENGPAYRRK